MPQTNLALLRCGNCGFAKFTMYQDKKTDELTAECTGCKSTTLITVSTPKIQLEFGENSEGRLSQF